MEFRSSAVLGDSARISSRARCGLAVEVYFIGSGWARTRNGQVSPRTRQCGFSLESRSRWFSGTRTSEGSGEGLGEGSHVLGLLVPGWEPLDHIRAVPAPRAFRRLGVGVTVAGPVASSVSRFCRSEAPFA